MEILNGKIKKHQDNYQEDERDAVQDRIGIWEDLNLYRSGFDEGRVNFIYHCFIENLNHARHVENERLTFNSIYFAITVGTIAVAPKSGDLNPLWGCVYLCVFFAGIISITLTRRWNNSFDRHYKYAKRCYKLLYDLYFGEESSKSTSQGEMDKEFLKEVNQFPLYCFSIRNPVYGYVCIREHKISTKTLYLMFCYLIQAVVLIVAVYSFRKTICAYKVGAIIGLVLLSLGYLAYFKEDLFWKVRERNSK